MSTRMLGRALLNACKPGSLAEVSTYTPKLFAADIPKHTAPPFKMAMAAAAQHGHSDILRYLLTNAPPSKEPFSTPWDPIVEKHDVPDEWSSSVISDYVVLRAVTGGNRP